MRSQSVRRASIDFKQFCIDRFPILPLASSKNFPMAGCLSVEKIVSLIFSLRYLEVFMHLVTKFACVLWFHSVGVALLLNLLRSDLDYFFSKSNSSTHASASGSVCINSLMTFLIVKRIPLTYLLLECKPSYMTGSSAKCVAT